MTGRSPTGEGREAAITPLTEMQRALDTALAKADAAVRERFARAVAGGSQARSAEPEAEGAGGPDAVTLAGAGASVGAGQSGTVGCGECGAGWTPVGQCLAVLRAVLGIDGDGQLSEDGGETMERRMFMLQAAVLAGFGVGGTAAVLEAVRQELDRSVAEERGATGVDEWQAIVHDYGQTYLTTAPAALLQTLLVDLHGVQVAMRRHPGEPAQRELLRVGALLAAFTAQTVANVGDLVGARRWWRSARRAADEVADPVTMLWVRGKEVVRAGYERRPVDATLQLVDEAEARLAEAPPAVLAEFWSGKAQTLALAGRHGAAEQTLCRVRELPMSTAHSSLFDFAEENLRYTESFVYSHAGRFAEAERAQQAALALYADSNLRCPAQIELQRALCLVRSGDLAAGARHAQTVITGLPMMHRIRPVADLGQKVLGAIPAPERRHGWAQEYRECLDSSLPAGGTGTSSAATTRA